MKTLLLSLITLTSVQAFSAEVVSGGYDYRSDNIVVEVVYQGGCKDHNLQLRLNMCNRSLPMSCVVDLVDNTEDDVCRGVLQKTFRFAADNVIGDLAVERLIIRGENETSALIEIK
jgi:hypothetical protein